MDSLSEYLHKLDKIINFVLSVTQMPLEQRQKIAGKLQVKYFQNCNVRLFERLPREERQRFVRLPKETKIDLREFLNQVIKYVDKEIVVEICLLELEKIVKDLSRMITDTKDTNLIRKYNQFVLATFKENS